MSKKKDERQFKIRQLLQEHPKIKISDLSEDLLPLFEQRSFIEAWLEGFKENFAEFQKNYL